MQKWIAVALGTHHWNNGYLTCHVHLKVLIPVVLVSCFDTFIELDVRKLKAVLDNLVAYSFI